MYIEYLKPVSKELQNFAKSCSPFSIGNSIMFSDITTISKEKNKKNKIVIIGVKESRSKIVDVIEDVDFSFIRRELYEFKLGDWNIDIYDFGDLEYYKEKYRIEDIFEKVLHGLLRDDYFVIILGGAPSLGFQQYKSYNGLINNVSYISIDHKLRLAEDEDQTTDDNYLTKIISKDPFNLLEYTNLGYQTYFVAQEKLDLVNQLNFEVIRLGNLIESIQEAEVYSRSADAALLNLSSIQGSSFSSSKNITPNGFSSREICSLVRYLGLSNKLTSLYICDYIESYIKLDHILAAEIIWYFIDGKNHRPEIKRFSDTQYFDKICVNKNGDYVFYKNVYTNQWWIQVETVEDTNKIVAIPCSETDYNQALSGEIPNKLWKYYKKFF